MAERQEVFSKGDWIVHASYGVGQVKRIEKKSLGGEKDRYYRIESEDTTYWLPLEGYDAHRVRRLASREEFRSALEVLEEESAKMAQSFKKRQSRIRKVVARGRLPSMLKLVRDLWGRRRRRKKGLSNTERKALQRFMDQLVDEWAIAEDISREEARSQLRDMLDKSSAESM